MRDEAWELAARRSELPMVMHFAVCPHSPRSGALLDEYGVPVLTHYARVDWKALSSNANSAIEGLAPKDVKVYVADDAVDVMDVLNISTDTGRPFQGKGGFEARLSATLKRLTMADMRGGIIKMAGKFPELHVNTTPDGTRPPLGALIVSVKFSRGTQIIDYLDDVSNSLFGAPAFVQDGFNFHPRPTTGKMPAFLADWLRAQFGVIYAANCTVVLAGRTFSV